MHSYKTMYRVATVITFLALLLSICACSTPEPVRLADIAYDSAYSTDNTIYIRENFEYVPYIVVTNDYSDSGNCLLLRKSILCNMSMSDTTGNDCPAYYPTSNIDEYLNTVYLDSLEPNVRQKICDSNITVTAKDSLGVCGTEKDTIQRKVFLLSYTETGGASSLTLLTEGQPLQYFLKPGSRTALNEDAEPASWWLRTPNTWDTDVMAGISAEGIQGIGGIHGLGYDYTNCVRPAFCLPGSLGIKQADGRTVLRIMPDTVSTTAEQK